MTIQEMIDAFLLEYDLNGSGAVAGFEEEEIVEDDAKQLQELMKMLGDINGRIYQGVGEVNNTSEVSKPTS